MGLLIAASDQPQSLQNVYIPQSKWIKNRISPLTCYKMILDLIIRLRFYVWSTSDHILGWFPGNSARENRLRHTLISHNQ